MFTTKKAHFGVGAVIRWIGSEGLGCCGGRTREPNRGKFGQDDDAMGTISSKMG